jgi:Uma2 family endonuclease
VRAFGEAVFDLIERVPERCAGFTGIGPKRATRIIAGCGARPAVVDRARLRGMSDVLRKPMALPEFLAWEEQQELRYEFNGVQPVAMAGGTDAHEAIGGALRALLRERLRGKPCRTRGPTMKVQVMGRIRYPDAFVYCKPVAPTADVIHEPVVIFEVVSASTSHTDRIVKLREYQATPSVQRYIILEQDSIAATVFARQGPDWTARAMTEGDTLAAPEIGIELALADIYSDVELPPDDAADEMLRG